MPNEIRLDQVAQFQIEMTVPAYTRGQADRILARMKDMFVGFDGKVTPIVPAAYTPAAGDTVPAADVEAMIAFLVENKHVAAGTIAEAMGKLVLPKRAAPAAVAPGSTPATSQPADDQPKNLEIPEGVFRDKNSGNTVTVIGSTITDLIIRGVESGNEQNISPATFADAYELVKDGESDEAAEGDEPAGSKRASRRARRNT